MATLTIDSAKFEKLRHDQGLDTLQSLADALGINKGTASRVIRGESAPGPRFISSVLLTFPIKFEDVFEVIEPAESSDTALADVPADIAA